MVRSADSFRRSRSMPPWMMPNRDCVLLTTVGGTSDHLGTAAFGCTSGWRPDVCRLGLLPAQEPVEPRSTEPPGGAVPRWSVLAHGTSCLCSSKYFLLRSAQRHVISIET